MTPSARVAAAIDILDSIFDGRTAEQALSDWGRNSRFAGSKDRAALRDLVFDALRKRASAAALGGGFTGRGLMIGLLAGEGADPTEVFTGEGHAPSPLTDEELDVVANPPALSEPDAADLPAWLWPIWQADLKENATDAAQILRTRAPLYLRVNNRRATVEDAISGLAAENIEVSAHPSQPGCLRVETNPRRVKLSQAFTDGLVEVQDAASQIAVSRLAVPKGARVLDYCAGGGGKALAIADIFDCAVTAHDIAMQRTKDIEPRAERAGVSVQIVEPTTLSGCGPFDVVVVDAPCSGSGTWRRNPEAKWNFTDDKLRDFSALQGEVLAAASAYIKPDGLLYYMTCSVFEAENDQVIADFVDANSGWGAHDVLRLCPSDTSDGFYLCQLARNG